MMLHRLSLIVMLCLAGAMPIGSWRAEVQVNTYTTGGQRTPAVALDADGDFVVVWQSYGSDGTDSSGFSIQGQRFASDGSAIGGQFQVNTYTTNFQRFPSLALDADGDFVVVWESLGSGGTDSSGASVQGQRFASDGSAIGDEFQVNTFTTDFQGDPSVALAANGDFVVVWESYLPGGPYFPPGRSVQGRRFASDGSPVGDFQVNLYTVNLFSLSLDVDADGDFVVVWELDSSVDGQRFASDGSTLGGPFQVNTYTTHFLSGVSVSLDADGDFVVVWGSDVSVGTDSSGSSIQGQRFASDGSTVGGQFQVNTYTLDSQLFPGVSLDADGDFVVVWESFTPGETFDTDVHGQRFASDGSTVGGQFQVNTYTPYYQSLPSVALDADGDFVVAWESGGVLSSSDHNIQKSEPGLTVHQLFTDGFESGDTLAWSLTVP